MPDLSTEEAVERLGGQEWLLYWRPGNERWPQVAWGDSPRPGAIGYITVEVVPKLALTEAQDKVARLERLAENYISRWPAPPTTILPDHPNREIEARRLASAILTEQEDTDGT